MPLCQIWLIFAFCLVWEKMSFSNYVFHLCWRQVETFGIYGSLTLNNGKLIWYFRRPSYAIIASNMTHFDNSDFVWNERKMPFSEVWVSPVLMQNPGIWNFHGPLTLNNGKLIWYFTRFWYDIHEHAAFMDVLTFFALVSCALCQTTCLTVS